MVEIRTQFNNITDEFTWRKVFYFLNFMAGRDGSGENDDVEYFLDVEDVEKICQDGHMFVPVEYVMVKTFIDNIRSLKRSRFGIAAF